MLKYATIIDSVSVYYYLSVGTETKIEYHNPEQRDHCVSNSVEIK